MAINKFTNFVLRSMCVLGGITCMVFVSSCAHRSGYVDKEIEPYFKRFEEFYEVKITNMSATVVDNIDSEKATERTVGVCRKWFASKHRDIEVLREYWNSATDYGKEQIIFHELGHCLFDLSHTNSLYDDGCPDSIMHKSTFGNYRCYAKHREDLLLNLGYDW